VIHTLVRDIKIECVLLALNLHELLIRPILDGEWYGRDLGLSMDSSFYQIGKRLQITAHRIHNSENPSLREICQAICEATGVIVSGSDIPGFYTQTLACRK